MSTVHIRPVGIIHTPFGDLENMPVQPKGAEGVRGTIEFFPEFQEGLQDLELFSHLILLYHFHKATREALNITPFLDTVERGVYSTRSPLRPNHIGLSVVSLVERKGNSLTVENIDVLNGTPLLDVKPYVPEFDGVENPSSGWMTKSSREVAEKRSDRRFL